MKKFINRLDRILGVLSLVLAACMASLVIFSVFLRYVLGLTFVWAEEVITMLFVSTTFFGGALAFRENEHIGITSFLTVLPPGIKKMLSVLGLVIVGAVQVFVIETSIDWIQQIGSRLTAGLRVKIGWFYTMVPINAFLILLYVLFCLFMLFFGRDGDECTERADEKGVKRLHV